MRKSISKKAIFIFGKMAIVFWLLITNIVAVAGENVDSGKSNILLLKGLAHQPFLESYIKKSGFTIENVYLAITPTGFVLDKPFPSNLGALEGIKIVVLADIPASSLGGLMGRRTLKQFVENGGSLLVFAGPFSYGKGEIAGTPLEDIIPVTTTGPWDIVKATSPAVKPTKDSPLTKDLNWSQKPVLYYCHKTVPKPDSDILLECDGIPVLATCKFGKGKVATFIGTNFGVVKERDMFFYEWPDYETLLNRVMQWLLKGYP